MSAIAATPVPHDDTYFRHRRDDVLRHVPDSARSILSTGCGAGITETELVRRGARVTGIELDPEAAGEARGRGLDVLEGDAGAIAAQLADRTFDCLIYADVLEHITDPEAILAEHVGRLEPGGTVIVSVPNFRYVEVIWQLVVRGHIRYTDAGIFDRTHVRVTTRRMVGQWLRDAGLEDLRHDHRINRRRDRVLAMLGFGLPADFLAQQVIVTGRKPGGAARA